MILFMLYDFVIDIKIIEISINKVMTFVRDLKILCLVYL